MRQATSAQLVATGSSRFAAASSTLGAAGAPAKQSSGASRTSQRMIEVRHPRASRALVLFGLRLVFLPDRVAQFVALDELVIAAALIPGPSPYGRAFHADLEHQVG